MSVDDEDFLLPVYKPIDINCSFGAGSYLYTNEGSKYLDFCTGIGVSILGHGHNIIEKAFIETIKTGIYAISNFFSCNSRKMLAKKISELSFNGYVFFSNSGTECTELAIKISRRYAIKVKNIKNPFILTFSDAFHGRTLASMAASNNKDYLESFDPITPGFLQTEFNNIENLQKINFNNIGGILIEPIQGESGINIANENFLYTLRQIANINDIPLIYDETQCGTSRTGKFFCYQNYNDVEPDIVYTAKGLGGGVPIGACIVKRKFGKLMQKGSHGSTFAGNPVVTNVALKVVEEISNPEFLHNISSVGQYFKSKLELLVKKSSFYIEEVRGMGLFLGIKINSHFDHKELFKIFIENGLLSVPARNNVIRFLPPLNVTKSEIDQCIEIILESIKQFILIER